ncbi:MAG: thiosulfate/3-mercaptopyruvate sulfurtransferase [Paraglaciecola sp.]|jgi:thiosulfate/3-mercaptopyruvate sulfurtransferase
MEHVSALVSPFWLNMHLHDEKLVILMTTMNVIASGLPEVAPIGYIPGTQSFDFENSICEHDSPFPHTMPTAEVFQKEVRRLGINRDSLIIVYDNHGIYTAPRVWWMFKVMGHQQVYILQGGLPKWLQLNFDIQDKVNRANTKGDFMSCYQSQLICDAQCVLAALDDNHNHIVDARCAGRFSGTELEPRAGLRAGHMPGAVNLPFDQCVNNSELLAPAQLVTLFSQLALGRKNRLIFTCGSGVTACVLALAAYEAGFAHITVYDNSWCEWGGEGKFPVTVN